MKEKAKQTEEAETMEVDDATAEETQDAPEPSSKELLEVANDREASAKKVEGHDAETAEKYREEDRRLRAKAEEAKPNKSKAKQLKKKIGEANRARQSKSKNWKSRGRS